MLKRISLQALQFAIHQALSLDSSISEKLLPLNHKVIEIIISPLKVHFYICIEGGKLLLKTQSSQPPDTIIYSNPMGLIRLSFLPSSKMRSIFNDQIKISGDIELGHELKKIFDNMYIDWEGHLAYFTGDVVAHHIGKVMRKGRDFRKSYTESFKKSSKEYLVYELQSTPSQAELDTFYEDVDELRLRNERLEAHIQFLLAHYEKN